LRAGFTRAYYGGIITKRDLTTPIYGDEVLKQWGIQGIANPPHLTGLPYVYINNWQAMNYVGSGEWDTRYVAFDNLSWVKGRHNFKTGVSFTKLLDDSIATGPFWGYFTFTGQFTGEPFADFLLGLPGTFQSYSGRPVAARRMWEDGAFFQDEFRATRKLTLSYGLRWDKFTIPYDKNGLYYNFDPSTLSLVMPSQHALQSVSPAWPTSTFPVKLASQASYPDKLVNGSSSWQPRLGFAYKFGDRTVLRGGYGVYTGAIRFNGLQTGGPFALTSTYINSVDPTSPTGAKYAWPNPFPSTTSVASVLSATGVSKNYRPPYTQNWQLTLERQLATNWGLRASYMGAAGGDLIWNQNLNQEVASTSTYSASRLPYPGLQSIGYVQNGAHSIYDSFQVMVTHPWARGLYTTLAYTRASNRSDSPVGYSFDQTAYSPEYSYNRRRDWGNDPQDVPNDIVANWVGDLPFGRGRRFASNANRWVNGVIGNWTLSGIFSRRSGLWFTPTETGTDIGNIGNSSSRRPSLVPGCNPQPGGLNVHGQWYNPACFTLPASGQLGDARLYSLHSPSGWTIFIDPYKDFPLKFREGATLRIGAQIFNLSNHPTYGIPNANVVSPTAGVISSVTNVRGSALDESGQRQIFFVGRLIF
jgi:hypothetical protein